MAAVGPHLCSFCKRGKHRDCINGITAEYQSSFTCVCARCHPDPQLDAYQAAENKRLGMERSTIATPFWYRRALWDALVVVLCEMTEVCGDRVWDQLGTDFPRQLPQAPRAAAVLGPVMQNACRAGLMVKIGMTISELVTRHMPDIYLYESKIVGHDPVDYPYRGKR
ncbi:MAG TPA: hypothetical protein VFI41_04770 [Gemmatimonadales bacterium]|nr:hypothetical protein [Gemmatimonadales bacterium]